jgi:hypothetical protein
MNAGSFTRRGVVTLLGAALVLLAGSAAVACGGSKDEVIIKTAAGVELKAADIDRDPYALLPEAPLVVVRTDAQAQFRSAVGQRLLQIVQSRLPVPPSADFVPERDLDSLLVGVYSMQGVDFAAVARGRFKPEAIQRAADGITQTPLGAPLVRSQYAGRTLYTVGNVGFTLLTPNTALYGNETGMRRALDRIGRGALDRRIPQWLESYLKAQTAPIAAGLDFTRPEGIAFADSMAQTRGLATATAIGNFDPPGMNMAGRLGYRSADAAAASTQSILELQQRIQSFAWLTSLIGMGNPIQRLQLTPSGNNVDFQLSLQGGVVSQLIEQLAAAVGAPPARVQANAGG